MRDRETVAEIVCLAVLLGYLIWVPLPFGSASDTALTALVLPPLLLCAAVSAIGWRHGFGRIGRAGRFWTVGAGLTVAFIAMQLLPLPGWLLRFVSPESARMWAAADRIAALAGVEAGSFHPISIDPADTTVQLFRVSAYAATFIAAMLLVRDSRRRLLVMIALSAMAIFEASYAVRQAVLGRYDIWGWSNTLIFNRATGTFVNPNHFAHYTAIILPLAVFLCALAWHTSAGPGTPFAARMAAMIERRWILFGFGILAVLACVTAMLVSQSRGAMLATVGGFAVAGALAGGRRPALRAALAAGVVVLIFITVFVVLGRRTGEAKHLQDVSTLVGRRSAMKAAFRIWTGYPMFGSGAGTFENLAPRTQDPNSEVIANHAHNDYAESLATTGAVGFLIGVVPLMAGTLALARMLFGGQAGGSWRRRAFCTAALTSIAIALIHALVDFNFYIPANPVTLAVIAGAAAGIREHERGRREPVEADDSLSSRSPA